ncbi:GNAT family N-acetyltransferase [Microbacterium betulae]|uniref:GNAT family N-acetyltransferase n=1 Tax=Microbacterium betulae TaxID=2981139 RepID=A0AA97FF18_9MICO|nr:GNAT family N-acetyltransferase [Microbacterium sp. AB]WOF21953.1 GNAT family N-acetyltransferase [Microbacterium sp. AB]
MVQITTRPATPALWGDVQTALTGGGDGRTCQCIWPMLGNADWRRTTVPEREAMLRDEIDAGPPPGIVAYADGEAAGWVRVGPRTAQHRLGRMRIVKSGSAEPLDDASVWAVTCFSIRREHRRQGVTRALLDAAIGYAAENGARVLEAYPIDTDAAGKTNTNDLYVGTLSTFERAGFDVVARPTATRAVVSRALAPAPAPAR